MAKLTGTLRDGSPFEMNVNARTKRLRLYQHALATLDVAGLSAATNLEICETGHDEIVIPSLEPFAGCTALTDLSLAIPAATDLSPLTRCRALKHLHLHVFGDDACDIASLAKIHTIESLSISQKGAPPPLDVGALHHLALRRLSLSGITNTRLDFEWTTPAFESFYMDNADQLVELDLSALANTQLQHLHLLSCNQLTQLDLSPLRMTKLEVLHVINHGVRFIDVTPLAKLATLANVELDGKDAPFLSEHAVKTLASPALRAWHKAGQLTVE